MKILILDCNIFPECWGAPEIRRYGSLLPQAEILVRRAPAKDLPDDLNYYDGVIISGSITSMAEKKDWITELENKIRPRLEAGSPTLGICFGHQVIARVAGGPQCVGSSLKPEYGWTALKQLKQSSFLSGIPKRFYSYSSHADEVKKLPRQFQVLAESQDCKIQAFASNEAPIFGIQFHPEKQPSDVIDSKKKGASIREKRLMAKRFYDPKVAHHIFNNFFRTISGQSYEIAS